MSGPYVAFRVNRTSKAILTDTITFEPGPTATFTNPFEWLVVCDSNEKLVIRALEDGKRSLHVIALAELRGLTLVERRQLDPAVPSMDQWAWLEEIVFPTRERGYALAWKKAADPATLTATTGTPVLTPEQVWELAGSGGTPPPVPPARVRAATWPPPITEPATPLWSSPGPAKPQAQKQTYLELLFDHANVRVIDGSVRYAPDHSMRPAGLYQHKLVCDPQGNVFIFATPDPDRDMVRLATCRWKDSGLCDRRQDGREPDDFQWMALEDALRAELSRAP